MNRFKFAMEDDAGMLNPEIFAAVAEIPKTQVDMAVAASEVAMQSADVSNCISDIQTGQDDIVTLSEIQDVLVEASNKTDGIDETTAVVTQIAVEAIYARLGLVVKPIPAMETFASIHSRKVATNVAIESIGDSVKRIWDAIVRAIKLLIDKIKSFAQTFFENRGQLEKMSKIMRSRANALEHNDLTTTLSAQVSKAISLHYLDEDVTTHSCAHNLLSSIVQCVEYAEEISSVLHRKASDVEIKISKSGINPNEVLDTIVSTTFKYYNIDAKIRGEKSHPVLPLTHQRSIFIDQNSDGLNFLTVKGVEGTVNVTQLSGLKKSEILHVLDGVDGLLKKISTFDKIRKQQESALEVLLKRVYVLDKSFNKDSESYKADQAQLRYLITLSGFISVTIPDEYFKTIKTVLKLINESIELNK